MKKNLLALTLLGLSTLSFGQDTYIKDAVIVKVNPNTLFYNGGSVKVSTTETAGTTEKIINNGNIKIVGDFNNENTTGKNFVNKYVDPVSFGQLIISERSNSVIPTGKISMERSRPDVETNDDYIISLPFRNLKVNEIVNSFKPNVFRGDCPVNTPCGIDPRYRQTLFKWDIRETEYDAQTGEETVEAGSYYLLNTRNNTNFYNAVSPVTDNFIQFSGNANNLPYTKTNIISGLVNGNQTFANQSYGLWKNRLNNYNEPYHTYLGNNGSDASMLYGKNLHRFGNPYTSNLDLSDVSKVNSWIKFNVPNSAAELAPTEVYTNQIRFRVFKFAPNYKITWTIANGNTSTVTGANTLFNAFLSKSTADNKYFWTGSPEALIIKPYETFYVDYYTLSSSQIGNTRIVTANINLTDLNKTFNTSFAGVVASPNASTPGVYERNNQSPSESNLQNLLANTQLQERGLVTDFDFTQLELYLSKEGVTEGSAAYLLNANFMTTGNATQASVANNPLYFYEENIDGSVSEVSQTLSNYFNSEDYVGKPLRVGFKNLIAGQTYNLNLNLFEYSILNKVNTLNLGRYYLLDKQNNTIVDVNAETSLSFTYDDTSNDRFEFYWNERPESSLNTIDLESKATYLYKNNDQQFVRFENQNTTATIEVIDLTGRVILKKTNINTNADYRIELSKAPSVYIVNITYADGKVVSKKTINK